MTTDVVYATVDEDQEQVARTLAYYDFIALPVVDATQKLVGIITYDDAMDIAEAESTEDILKSGAVTPLNELSLKTAPILRLYQKRVFWLVILVFGSLLSESGLPILKILFPPILCWYFSCHYWWVVAECWFTICHLDGACLGNR